jgi:uncharacterized protein YdaU (DUF1376 family)
MTMHYMPFYTGDYFRHTRHLSMAEHGAFFLLITYCWDMEGPVPLDERKIFGICNARSSDEMETARRVLTEFFVKMDDGWYNERVMEELEKAKAKYRQKVEAGKASARARSTKECGLAGNGRSTDVQRTFNDPESESDPDLDLRERVVEGGMGGDNTSTLSLNTKEKTEKVTLTPDWEITEEWITAASSERSDLTRDQILISAKRFKFRHLSRRPKNQISLAEWLGWIEIEDVNKQPSRSAMNGKGPPQPPLFQGGQFVGV